MKKFLLYTLATITGLLVTSFLFFIIMIGSMSVMLASGNKTVNVKENSLLVINTGDAIPERTNSDPFANFDIVNMTYSQVAGLNDILLSLEKAAADPNIVGVLIESGTSSAGWASLYEVRKALQSFKDKSGKSIFAYSEQVMDQKSYFLSSVADAIYINPTTNIEFSGISGQVMFYKKILDKLGVEVQVLRHGKFKGAVEPYMLETMSPENREQIKEYTGSIWNSLLKEISVSRNITVDQLNQYADNLSAYNADSALECGMIDGFAYYSELEELIKEKIGLSNDDINKVSILDYKSVPFKGNKNTSKNKISVIYASGNIVSTKSDVDIEGRRYAELVKKEREDSTVKAIVLRVNSPGGEAIAADMIWKEVQLASQIKPVIVSMGDYAASGGYYISAAATKIYADPVTITGSIGVFGLIPNAEKLLEDKLGIMTETVNTNENSGFPSVFRQLSSRENTTMQQSIENVYGNFVNRVSLGRDMSFEEVDNIGQGRVWSGSSALNIGLVDEMGGLEDAIDEAVRQANIDAYTLKELPVVEDSYTKLMKQLGGTVRASVLEKEYGAAYPLYNELMKIGNFAEGIQARLPYIITIK